MVWALAMAKQSTVVSINMLFTTKRISSVSTSLDQGRNCFLWQDTLFCFAIWKQIQNILHIFHNKQFISKHIRQDSSVRIFCISNQAADFSENSKESFMLWYISSINKILWISHETYQHLTLWIYYIYFTDTLLNN